MSKLLIPLALLLGSIAIIFILIVPGWQRFLAVRANTKHLQDIDSEIDTLTQKRDALVQEISAISKDNFQRLNQVLPSTPQGPEFLVILQRLATIHGLRVQKLNLSGTVSTKPRIAETGSESFVPAAEGTVKESYKKIGASIDLIGQYGAFKDFLHDLESYIRIIDVEAISLMPNESGFDFQLTVKTYYQ